MVFTRLARSFKTAVLPLRAGRSTGVALLAAEDGKAERVRGRTGAVI